MRYTYAYDHLKQTESIEEKEEVGFLGLVKQKKVTKYILSSPTSPNQSQLSQANKEWKELFINATQRFKAALLNNQVQ